MSDKNRNPFVVEIEPADAPNPSKPTEREGSRSPQGKDDQPENQGVKMVIKPDSSTFVTPPPPKTSVTPETTVVTPDTPVKKVTKPKEEAASFVPQKKSTKPELARREVKGGKAERTKIQWGTFFAGVGTTLLITGAAGALWWAYNQRIGLEPQTSFVSSSPTPTQTPEPTSVVQPTPTPFVLSRGSIRVDVLNGTSARGKAATISQQIQRLGYKKGSTGNAARQTGSTISFSEDLASISAQIREDLSTVVDGLEASDDTLQGTGVVRLVIGQ